MGYLTDNTPPSRNHIICQDLYLYRLVIKPGFASNRELQVLVRDVVPDVEEWQFSGRRFRAVTPFGPRARVVHPATYAQNSRKVRNYDERVVFAFHTPGQRQAVADRLTNQGFKFEFQDEPTPSTNETIVIIVP